MPIDPPPDWVIQRRRAIGEHIRVARRAAGLSQHRLAARAGIDHKTVHRIEVGAPHKTALDTLLLIADAIGVPLSHLVRDDPDEEITHS